MNDENHEAIDAQVAAVQIFYPRIYMACHTEHIRARSSAVQLSSRDSGVLAHLSTDGFSSPAALARHLNIAPSTLSEAIHGLVALGYVATKINADDERKTELRLTDKGLAVMRHSSVLDTDKLTALLQRMPLVDRARAVDGLRLLAEASLVMSHSDE
jgi:DNA-binding MarR family transcriptional regulator